MKKIITITILSLLFLTVKAQDLMTIREIFDFSIGDEFQSSGFASGQPPNADRITILDKYFSPENDTLFYVQFHNSYYTSLVSDPPYLEYHFWTKTDTISFTKLDSSITFYNGWVSYDSSMFQYDTINQYSPILCDSLINGYYYVLGDFEPVSYSHEFGKGLGLVKDFYNDPAEYSGFDSELFYYKKNNISCGTPDNTTVSITEQNHISNFTISPNPAENYFRLSNNSREQYDVKIYNPSGELIMTYNSNADKSNINCSSLIPGLYIVCIRQEQNSFFRRLIKR